ncbi:MAG: thioredoxin family protein [Flavobacteriales bacterium]
MKKSVFILIAIVSISLLAFTKKPSAATIKWLSIEEAEKLSKKNPKKLLVDVYTNWCGWCKEMDRTTFSDPAVIEYVNAHFYAVKFNAEGFDTIHFNNQTFVNPGAATKTKATHQLAIAIGSKEGRIGYPTISYLDEQNHLMNVAPGYYPAKEYLMYLKYINDGAYKTQPFEDFANNPSNQ